MLKYRHYDIQIYNKQVFRDLKPSRVVVCVFSPRRSGKTVIMNLIREKIDASQLPMVHGENLDAAEALSVTNF